MSDLVWVVLVYLDSVIIRKMRGEIMSEVVLLVKTEEKKENTIIDSSVCVSMMHRYNSHVKNQVNVNNLHNISYDTLHTKEMAHAM